jgi:hypothetical protein
MKMEVEIYLIKLLLLSQIVNTLVLVLILYVLDQIMKTPPK